MYSLKKLTWAVKPIALAIAVTTLAGCETLSSLTAMNSDRVVTGLERVGRSASQGFDQSAAEIVAFDKTRQRIFTVNANSGKVDVFDGSNVSDLKLLQTLDVAAMVMQAKVTVTSVSQVGAANSVAVHGDLAAVAVEAGTKTDAGWVVFINLTDLSVASVVDSGSLPDMVTFTPDGSKAIVAIEGEPTDYQTDPEGRIDIIDTQTFTLRSATFTDFNVGGLRHSELPEDVRVFGTIVDANGKAIRPSTVAEDLEPEYVAVSADSKTAYVSLQEANAIAVVDIDTASVSKIFALGYKDHSLVGNGIDASDKDKKANIATWPVYGMYQPDSIATYRVNGKDYIVTANEGDSRADWGTAQTDGTLDMAGDPLNLNMEEFRVKDLKLDPTAFPNADQLQDKAALGRLKVTSKLGDTDQDGDFDQLYVYGARSFSIWDATDGTLVFDSGDQFEQKTLALYGDQFNNDNGESDPDGRSDAKGPEPEAITVGEIDGKHYAFIGLERMGGVMVYDITNPSAPEFISYVNDRDLSKDPLVDKAAAGDLGPEGFKFVPEYDSPNGKRLLIVGNEVSGTTSVYQIQLSDK
ncbi:alkaline phosphatase [Maribrevibacterium harenarium]|uniref:Alkaline phosphatase n=1 Tax=Maribrevibacterium harenarium TaxID=2589817 RepID=A0A501WXW0_9GAMM|nr:choice-of-anchor I family protein [Maribrevibacterium harenarium]TPE53330.1 alkaline phosphatase [Maribrevibacterium harenarium]